MFILLGLKHPLSSISLANVAHESFYLIYRHCIFHVLHNRWIDCILFKSITIILHNLHQYVFFRLKWYGKWYKKWFKRCNSTKMLWQNHFNGENSTIYVVFYLKKYPRTERSLRPYIRRDETSRIMLGKNIKSCHTFWVPIFYSERGR